MSNHNRSKLLVSFAQEAGLTVIRRYDKENRVCVDVRAENGLETSFCMPLKDGDARNDMNNRSSIRRWASLNAVPSFTAKAKPDTDENKTTVKAANKTAAAPTPAEHELSRAEFFRLCEWVRTAINATVPNLEALSIAATKHIGHAVSEETVREAMELTSTPEPEHWKPIEPHVVVARELDALMKSLGQPTSPAFKRLMESLA